MGGARVHAEILIRISSYFLNESLSDPRQALLQWFRRTLPARRQTSAFHMVKADSQM
jgi:hypothetical protein